MLFKKNPVKWEKERRRERGGREGIKGEGNYVYRYTYTICIDMYINVYITRSLVYYLYYIPSATQRVQSFFDYIHYISAETMTNRILIANYK